MQVNFTGKAVTHTFQMQLFMLLILPGVHPELELKFPFIVIISDINMF